MKNIKLIGIAILIIFILNNDLIGQIDSAYNVVEPVVLKGPRIGITYLNADLLEEEDIITLNSNIITQFGWQFETMYFALDNGTAGLVEGVLLIGGLEQNKFLPSANLLIGLRGPRGAEFGFGPNISLSGAAFVIAAGVTIRTKYLNFPINLAFVPSSHGLRVSVLTGFNARVQKSMNTFNWRDY